MRRAARRRLALGLLPLALGSCAGSTLPPASPPPAGNGMQAPVRLAPAGAEITGSTDVIFFNLSGPAVQGGLIRGSVPPMGTLSLTLDGKPIPFASDGTFIIGFGRDAGPSAILVARRSGGAVFSGQVHVAARTWDVQSLPTLPKSTTPTPAFLARRKIELERIGAARAMASDSDGWRQQFVWPAVGRISGVFGSQRIYAGEPGEPHGGVDVARPTGAPVAAPADGVVVLAAASPFTLEGNLLMIDHGMGLNSAFLHLSRIDVKVGDHVRQGQPIGAVGMTGRATGPHLHWGMKWQDERIDPALLAGPMPAG